MRPISLIIAGPMVAGKTTAARTLVKTFKNTIHHPEINQYTIAGNAYQGGAFVDLELEEKINEANLARLKKTVQDKRDLIHLVETDIFHCVYPLVLGKRKISEEFEKEYKKLHQRARAGILFIDTKPHISWARRRGYYLKRAFKEVKKQGLKGVEAKKFREKMMKKYKKRIFDLYPLWLEMFESLPYPKIKIPNNGRSLASFEKKVVDGFLQLTKRMEISVKA